MADTVYKLSQEKCCSLSFLTLRMISLPISKWWKLSAIRPGVLKRKRRSVSVGNGIPKLTPDIPIMKSVQVAILSVLRFFVFVYRFSPFSPFLHEVLRDLPSDWSLSSDTGDLVSGFPTSHSLIVFQTISQKAKLR